MPLFILISFLLISFPSYAKETGFYSGYIYSDWEPTDIKGADYQTQGLNIGYLEFSSPAFDFRYEFTPENRDEQKHLLEEEEKRPSWEKYLAYVEIDNVGFEYQRTAFLTDVRLKEDKLYFAFDDGIGQPLSAGAQLSSMTIFEEFSILFYNQGDGEKLSQGLYVKQYQKPYSLTVDDVQLSQWIFDAKFSSVGYRIGYEIITQKGFYPIVKLDGYIGAGEIELVSESNLSDFLPDDSSIIYTELMGRFGFGYMESDMGFSWMAELRFIEYSIDTPESSDDEDLTLSEDAIFRTELTAYVLF
jgi:hypothetical protein